MPVVLSQSVEKARKEHPVLTVEAEYGAEVVVGSRYTAAHHQPMGPFAGRHIEGGTRPAPCNDPDIPLLAPNDLVLISHVDLDTIGGVLRSRSGCADLFDPEHQRFWDSAEWIDVNGPHRFAEDHPEALRIRAVWAWMDAHRQKWPRDQLIDVTKLMDDAGVMLRTLLKNETGADLLIKHGEQHRKNEGRLAQVSYQKCVQSVAGRTIALRQADAFVNHLYRIDGEVYADALVGFNPVKCSVSISLSDPIDDVSCREIVQKLWGTEAGGHDTIAGSPRDRAMTMDDAIAALNALMRTI